MHRTDLRKTHKKPASVFLARGQALIENRDAVQLLNNPSRQLLKHWRDHSNFPRAYFMGSSHYIISESLRAWLVEQGIEVLSND